MFLKQLPWSLETRRPGPWERGAWEPESQEHGGMGVGSLGAMRQEPRSGEPGSRGVGSLGARSLEAWELGVGSLGAWERCGREPSYLSEQGFLAHVLI